MERWGKSSREQYLSVAQGVGHRVEGEQSYLKIGHIC